MSDWSVYGSKAEQQSVLLVDLADNTACLGVWVGVTSSALARLWSSMV